MTEEQRKRLRDLALNGNGTASPYVPLLCSELLDLLDENDKLQSEADRLRKDGRDLIGELERLSVALNEVGYPTHPLGVCDRAIHAIKAWAQLRSR